MERQHPCWQEPAGSRRSVLARPAHEELLWQPEWLRKLFSQQADVCQLVKSVEGDVLIHKHARQLDSWLNRSRGRGAGGGEDGFTFKGWSVAAGALGPVACPFRWALAAAS